MTDDSIEQRFDALIRSRRSFVARGPAVTETRLEPAAASADDDIPVLTEVVDIEQATGMAPGPLAAAPLQPMLDALASDLAHAVEDRLAADLPEIVDGALTAFAADLRRGLAASVDSATRDFLARRQQLRLPFPEVPEEK
jgi:hypothetical protein